MSGLPWECRFPIDTKRVSAILADRFPELRRAHVEWLGEGWDFTAFLVNRAWVFRFPRREDEIVRLRRDNALTSHLASRLPLPIPVARWHGDPGEDFPWPFAGYPFILGTPASDVEVPPAARPGLAREMGEFLSALHSTPPTEVALAHLDRESEPQPDARKDDLTRALVGVRELISAETARDVRRFLETSEPPPPWPGPDRITHADLLPEHVILRPDGRRVSGIIDWSDATLGDPVGDFVGLVCWLGPEFGDRVLERYTLPVDEGFRRRAVHRAVGVAVEDAWYQVRRGDREHAVRMLRHLPRILSAAVSPS